MTVNVTPAQVRAIHTLAGKAGMDKDELHTMMSGVCGKMSTKALTISEAVRVIDRLRELTGEAPPTPTAPPATGRLTGKQLGYIQKLERELGWASDPKRLRGYAMARFKVSDPRFLTPQQASQLIEAMKAMLAGGRQERRTTPGGGV